MATRTTSIRLDDATLERLDQLANALDRSRNWVIDNAIKRYIGYEEWFLKAVEEGIESADRGELTPHEDVVAEWEQRLADRLDKSGKK